MASAKSVLVSGDFPVGTSLNLYRHSDWAPGSTLKGAPPGTAVQTGLTVPASGYVTPSGMVEGVTYVLGADLGGGNWHYVRVRGDFPAQLGDPLSLRRDFGLNPSMNASSLGTAINNAIVSAISANRPLSLGWEQWPVDVPVVIGGPLKLVGAGVRESWGSSSGFTNVSANVPASLSGAGIVQTSPAADGIQITCCGDQVDLEGFAVLFTGSHRYLSTGHGINCIPPALSTRFDHSCIGGQWRGVTVYGHDGNHYGFNILNSLLYTYEHLRSYGGGGVYFGQNSGSDFDYGNAVFSDTYIALFVGGSAHAYFVDNGAGHGFQLDYVQHNRLQTWTINPSPAIGGGVAVPTNAQKNITFAGNVTYHRIEGGDFETSFGNPMCAFPSGTGCSYSNDGASAKTNVTSIGVASPVSGTAYQNTCGVDVLYMIAATLNPSAALASAVVQVQFDSTGSFFTMAQCAAPAGGLNGQVVPLSVIVPTNGSVRTNLTNATASAVSSRLVDS